MSENKKNWIKLIALALALLIPCFGIIAICGFLPSVYYHTFLGELSPKFDRLNAVDSPKVVVVGGSSVAFGLDSALLSENVGLPVVNFGLYATLGTKIMLDLSKSNIGEGDIVVLAPEMDAQTLSLYFNAEAAWQGLDGEMGMLRYIGRDDWSDMAGGLWNFVAAKTKYTFEGALNPAGVYNRDSFNEYGDIAYARPYNTMLLGYDPTKIIDLKGDLFDEAFIDYVNDYVVWCEKQGAKVYFSFCPMNKESISATTTEDSLIAFYRFLDEKLSCDVISNVNDYIIDADYFYDSNFHLNDAGVVVRTAQLARDINRARGISTQVKIDIPDAPERPASDTTVAETDALLASYYTYAEYGTGWMITGVTDAGKALASLDLPASYEGKPVLAINTGAFEGCDKLTKLTIEKHIVQLMDGAFSGANALAKIYIHNDDADSIGVGDRLFDGAASGVKLVLTTQTSYESFIANYFWGKYGAWMTLEK